MEKIGKIVHLAKSGRLIVKIEEKSNYELIGQSLINDRGTKVGKVIELIGPVSSPYASVIPVDSKCSIGGVVYKSHNPIHRIKSSKKRNRVRRKRM